MSSYERAYEIKDEIIRYRRAVHQIAEVGMNLPKTVAYVKEELQKMGYDPQDVGTSGVSAVVGNGGRTVLIRADMDALPIKEESGLPFAATEGTCHACGHDIHTAVLLGTAKLLKERETELKGTVKFMFQPGEEVMHGAEDMVAAGILENPKVDYALGLHTRSLKNRGVAYTEGVRYASCNNFTIKVKGVAAHGAMPFNGVDAIMIGSHIVIAMQELVSRELPFNESAVLTIGQFRAGNSFNLIPGEAELKGTLRSYSNKSRELLKERLPELVQSVAEVYRGNAELIWDCDAPVLINDDVLAKHCLGKIREMAEGRFDVYEIPASTGSEDFAVVADRVPTFMFNLAMPDEESEVQYNLHNPKIRFDEDFMPVGSAIFVDCAMSLLAKDF